MPMSNPPIVPPLAIKGSGPPTSGGAGVPVGQRYQDTSASPPVVYENVGTVLVSSYLEIPSGNLV